MQKYLRILSAALAALSLAATAACGEAASQAAQTTAASADTTAAAETTTLDEISARKLVPDNLPDEDYAGREYRIVSEDDQNWDYYVEAETGDVINDAVYARNLAVEDRFNIKVTDACQGDYSKNGTFMTKSVMAGEDAFDLACHHVVNAGSIVMKSIFMNWYKVPHVDFTQPWWSTSTTDTLTYHGVALLAIGDLALTSVGRTYCVFFDRQKAESYNLGNVYDIVNDGKWTIDELSNLTKDIYVDVDGDGTRNYDDYYGFSSGSQSNINTYLWAFDNPVMKKDSDGNYQIVIMTDKVNAIVDKLLAIMYQNNGTYFNNKYKSKYDSYDSGHMTSRDMFIDGNVLFANGYLDQAIDFFRDIEDDYGIIPYPKWDEAQENYITMVDGNHASEAVPKTVSDVDYIGVITEAMNAESYKTLIPVYFETALKVKYARDAESVAMLDLLKDARIFDFGYVYDAWAGASFILQGIIQSGKNTFASTYAKSESKIQKHYQQVLDLFDEYAAEG